MADTTLQQLNVDTTEVNQANFNANQTLLTQRIHALNVAGQEIRIWIPDTSNFGHQSTSVHIMYCLVAVGVKKIRIIYVAGEDNVNWKKLYILILGLPPEPVKEYKLNNETILYFSEFHCKGEFEKVMPLGITGGWDGNQAEGLEYLRVKDFCCLQPFLWEGFPPQSPATNVIYTALNQPGKKPERWMFPKGYHMVQRGYYFSQPTLTKDDLVEFAKRENQLGKAGLIAVIEELVQRGEALLVPVYFSPGRTVADFHDILFNLFLGIGYFQNRQKEPLPVIVLVMARPQAKGYEALNNTFDGSEVTNHNWGILAERNLLTILKKKSARYKYLEGKGYLNFLQEDVRLFKDEDVSGAQLIDEVMGKKKSLVQVSAIGLPKVVFDYMYGLSNLTMLFEGAGTGNLVMNLGKPFIRVRGADDEQAPYTNMYRTNLEATSIAFARYGEELARAMEVKAGKWDALMQQPPEELPDQVIGEFLINANNSSRWPHEEFQQQQMFYHSIYEDKLLLALHYWLTLPQPPLPPPPPEEVEEEQ